MKRWLDACKIQAHDFMFLFFDWFGLGLIHYSAFSAAKAM